MVGHYPRRRYPAVFVGSSNGAMIHLAALIGAPWLPQTLLIPVRRRGGGPDQPAEALRLHRDAGQALLRANPDLELHHMHDANQGRLMVAGMSYFRIKWRQLPHAYARFLHDRLAPGGTVVTVECGLQWPTTRIGERYLFQHGALGGATPGVPPRKPPVSPTTWPGTAPLPPVGSTRARRRKPRGGMGDSSPACLTHCPAWRRARDCGAAPALRRPGGP